MAKIFKSVLLLLLLQASMPLLSQCSAPTNLSNSYSNNVSTFNWDAVSGATGYTLELKFVYDDWIYAEPFSATTNSFSLTGLYHSAQLEWRVSTVCSTSTSAPSSPIAYNVPCPEPNTPFANNITGTSATINWTAATGYNTNVSNFVVSYRLANTNNAWTSAGSTSTTSKTIIGLTSNTTYEYCINQSCVNGTSAPLIATFTTAFVPCDIPTNLTTSGATSSQATVAWNAVSGGQTYTVEYKPVSANTWTVTSSVTTNSKLLTGLSAATLYDVRAKATCTNSSISGYVSNQFTTYTSVCPAYGINSSEFIDQFTLGTINRTSGKEVGGYINTGLSTNLVKGSSTNAGVISGGFNPGIVFGENYAIYIDFNNNGNFSDAGERVAGPTYFATGAPLNFNIAIANNKPLGNKKMRVIVRRSTSTMAPCAAGFQGEVEDYNVNIISNKSTSGVDENLNRDITIYPNPSNGIFNIISQEELNSVSFEVMSIDGRIIEKKKFDNNFQNTIDISSQPEGIYILNITRADNSKSSHRLILTK
jgi:hypothetical protein